MSDQQRRGQRIIASGAAVAGARVISVLCSFIAIPLSLRYLGVEAFGVWAAITSIVGLMAFADLGIGNGVLNMLSAALGRDDLRAIRRITACAFIILSSLGAVFFLVALVIHSWVDWAKFFGAHSELSSAPVAAAVLVLAFAISINLPTTLIQRLQFALQLGYVNGLAQGFGGILSLVMIYGVTQTDWGLPGLAAATLFAPIATIWGSLLWMLHRHRQYLPRIADSNLIYSSDIFRTGAQFLFLGLVFCVCQLSDTLIIANILGAQEASVFTVHQKYVSPIVFIGGLALTPLWAAYGEAIARGDVAWVRNTFLRSLVVIAVASTVLCALLYVLLQPLMAAWLKGRVEPNGVLAAALLVWVTVELIGKAISTFFHGVGLVAEQVAIAAVFLPVCLLLKVVGAHWLGTHGVVLGTALAYVLVHSIPYWRMVRQWMKTAGNIEADEKKGLS